MAVVYGAMLAARTFDDPQRFSTIVEASIDRISAHEPVERVVLAASGHLAEIRGSSLCS